MDATGPPEASPTLNMAGRGASGYYLDANVVALLRVAMAEEEKAASLDS